MDRRPGEIPDARSTTRPQSHLAGEPHLSSGPASHGQHWVPAVDHLHRAAPHGGARRHRLLLVPGRPSLGMPAHVEQCPRSLTGSPRNLWGEIVRGVGGGGYWEATFAQQS